MFRTALAAALALVLASPAAARPHPVPPPPTPSLLDMLLNRGHPALRLRPLRPSIGQRSFVRLRGTLTSGRPSECRGIAWCGCWLRLRYGIHDVRLNLARAWAKVGTDAGGPVVGAIAVWRHHVGEITGVPAPGIIVLRSGNDGHRVRERARSTRGIIAYRWIL